MCLYGSQMTAHAVPQSWSLTGKAGGEPTGREGGEVKQKAGQKPAKGLMEAIRILKVALATFKIL